MSGLRGPAAPAAAGRRLCMRRAMGARGRHPHDTGGRAVVVVPVSALVRSWVRRDGVKCRIVAHTDSCTLHIGDKSVRLLRSDVLKVARDLEGFAWEAMGELSQREEDERAWPTRRR